MDDVHLAGSRGTACERLVLAVDDSGSMQRLAGARDAALAQMLRWAPRNLRPDDEIAVVDFWQTATVRVRPTPIGAIDPGSVGPATGFGSAEHTYLQPTLDAVAGLGPTACDVDVLLVSDGQLVDLPPGGSAGRQRLRGAHVHDLRLLVPSTNRDDPPGEFGTAFPDVAPARFDGENPDQTALAIAAAVASCTGQTLTR